MSQDINFSFRYEQWNLDGWNPITLGNDFLRDALLDQFGIWRRDADGYA